LQASIKNIIKHYGITHGTITITFDDCDKKRRKKQLASKGLIKSRAAILTVNNWYL